MSRHRCFQLTISTGVAVSAVLAVLHYDTHAIVAGFCANLVWIWEG